MSITQSTVQSATAIVRRELRALDIANHLSHVGVNLCHLPAIFTPFDVGFFIWEDSWWNSFIGFETGQIYVSRWDPREWGHSVRDVIRHEFGHAVEHYYPLLFDQRFHDTFGHGIDEYDYISSYAMKCESEDFCETFMIYLRYLGRLPSHYDRAVITKWLLIEDMMRRLAQTTPWSKRLPTPEPKPSRRANRLPTLMRAWSAATYKFLATPGSSRRADRTSDGV